jgi:hypothetical protein
LDYICWDTDDGLTGDGRFDLINTLDTDNGDAYFSYASMAPFVASEFMALSPQTCEVTHLTITGTVAALYFANDQTPTFNVTSDYARGLPASASKIRYQKQVVPIAQGQRGKTDMFWAQWRGSSSGSTSTRLYRLVLRYDEVETA